MGQELFIRRTHAAKIFRDRAGYANFRLNTIMIGLEGVKSGVATKPDDLAVGWNPEDPVSSAGLARGFATDSAMVFMIDAIDTYLHNLTSEPSPIQNAEFKMLLTGEFQVDRSDVKLLKQATLDQFAAKLKLSSFTANQLEHEFRKFQHSYFGVRKRPSLKTRFDALADEYDGISLSYRAAIYLFISWRNRHVHGNAKDEISQKTRDCLISDAILFFEEHSHLDIERTLRNYDARKSPTLKELSSLISISHRVVASLDQKILLGADIELLAKDVLRFVLSSRGSTIEKEITKYWGRAESVRVRKLASILAPFGFTPLGARNTKDMVTQLPSNFLLEFASQSRDQAVKALGGV